MTAERPVKTSEWAYTKPPRLAVPLWATLGKAGGA